MTFKTFLQSALVPLLSLSFVYAHASAYTDTVDVFKDAGQSSSFFGDSYAYAVFPTIGKGGFVVGGAHGTGRVFIGGRAEGDVTLSQVSVGAQAGGEAFSQIIFFQDKRALKEFESGSFQFGADVSVVAITAAIDGSAGSTGANAGASAGERDANTWGRYRKGMVVFTVAKGGAMFDASVVGQKFSFKSRHHLAAS
jgi:lipid-binding SYLF domain-containing protein